MRHTKVVVAWSFVLIVAMMLLGCGSSNSISAEQAQAISHQMLSSVAAAMQASFGAAAALPATERPRLSSAVTKIRPDQLPSCTPGQSCTVPVSFSGSCASGGTISVSGNFDFTLNSSGDGSASSSLTITPKNCSVDNLTINGDPNVTASTQINFQNNAVAFPITFTEGGGISYGPHPSGSCALNVNVNITSTTNCSVTGSVCGRSVSGNC